MKTKNKLLHYGLLLLPACAAFAEQPIYFQLQFALNRVKALALQHAEWKHKD